MSRFKAEGRRYHQNLGSSYMGAGRTESSFTFRAKPAFSKIKQIYGEHLEAIAVHYPDTKKGKTLSPEQREQIIAKITASQKKVIIRQIIGGTLVAFVTILLFIALWHSTAIKNMIIG